MKKIFDKWIGSKNFSIINYKKSWKECGNKRLLNFHTNGASKKNGDSCLDISFTIGYTVFNYTNFALQGSE